MKSTVRTITIRLIVSITLCAGRYRGMDPNLLDWYSNYLAEDVQSMTSGWSDETCYAGWESTKIFHDTGELAGLGTAREA